MKRTFSADFLRDVLDLPHNKEIVKHNEIVGTRRWSIDYDLVFEHEGKFWSTGYSVGATEQQDEGPWEYEKEVECVEVREVEKIVKGWEVV